MRFVLVAGLSWFEVFAGLMRYSGGAICLKCWDFMTISIKVLDQILRGTSLVHSITIINSFRRGLWFQALDVGLFRSSWCPLLDLGRTRQKNVARGTKSDCELSRSRQGESILPFFVTLPTRIKGGDGNAKKINLTKNIHPSIAYASFILFLHPSYCLI